MKWIKRIGVFVLVMVAILTVLFFVFNEAKPKGSQGAEADALAEKMLSAIDKTAWDSTTYVQWTFKSMNSYLWDKKRHYVKVSWDDQVVLLNTKTVDGVAYKKDVKLAGKEADDLIQKAWSFFCNDSFWLNAPAKAFDPGTERSIVALENGSQGLMVSYTSGGVTPGDAYLWILDENGLPTSWKMWVSIIPVGGIEFSWDQWKTLATGAKLATFHTSSILDLDISDLKGGVNLSSMGLTSDPFEALMN